MVRKLALIGLVSSVLFGTVGKAALVNEITSITRVDTTPIPDDLWYFYQICRF